MMRLRLSQRWRDYLEGAALAINLFPPGPEPTFIADDAEALASDWRAVGSCLYDAADDWLQGQGSNLRPTR